MTITTNDPILKRGWGKIEQGNHYNHNQQMLRTNILFNFYWNIVDIISRYIAKWSSNTYAAAKSLQSCPTLCDPIDGSPPGSPVPEILQARTLEWVAISFSNAWKWKVKVKSLSHVQLLATPQTAAHQAPPSMGLSRQEYWSGVPLPSSMIWYRQNESRFPISKALCFSMLLKCCTFQTMGLHSKCR